MFGPSAINADIRFELRESKQRYLGNWFAPTAAIVRWIPLRRILNQRSEFVLGDVEMLMESCRLIVGMLWRFKPATIGRR